MKVLITGGMGVIGAETTRKFVHEGHRPVHLRPHRDDRLICDVVDRVDIETRRLHSLCRACRRGQAARHNATSCTLPVASARSRRRTRRSASTST